MIAVPDPWDLVCLNDAEEKRESESNPLITENGKRVKIQIIFLLCDYLEVIQKNTIFAEMKEYDKGLYKTINYLPMT